MVALDLTAYVLEQYGLVPPSLEQAPLRRSLVKFGDGIVVEEGTTNLCTNPSFETNTTGWTANTNCTIARVTEAAWSGASCLRITRANATPDSCSAYFGLNAVNGTTYLIRCRVRMAPGHADTLLRLITGGSVTINSNVSAVANDRSWATLTMSITATATTLLNIFCADDFLEPAVRAARQVYLDAVQIEVNVFPTSYCDGSLGAGHAWTGTAHQSTSVRDAGVLTHTLPRGLPMDAITLMGWTKVGEARLTLSRCLLQLGNTTDGVLVFLSGAGGVAMDKYVSSVGTTVEAAVGSTKGDLVFWACTYDSGNLRAYGAKNDGAVVTAATATSTVSPPQTVVNVGTVDASSVFADSASEQLLIFSRVLSSGEIAAYASATSEATPASDPDIVYAAACGSARGTTNALMSSGSGLFRSLRSVAAAIEQITPATSNPDDDLATHKITVPSGSGIGQSDVIGFKPNGISSRYQVKRVLSPGGLNDELLVVNI